MSLPHLPVDLWAHVSTFLDSESLSSLSQVNTTFHGMCMHESQFRRMVPTEQEYYTHPMRLFRWRRALHHPPNYCISIVGTAKYDILCTVQDNLLVVNQVTKSALALPSGVTFNIYDLLNEPHIYPGPYPKALEYLQTVYTALPGGYVAFVHREQPSRLVVQNLLKSKAFIWEIQRDESVVARRIVADSSIAPAGNNAEWLIFYSSESCVTIINWRSGEVIGTLTMPAQETKLMMGECPTIDEMSVVGVVTEREIGSLKEINCYAFESSDIAVPEMFQIPLNKKAEVVLRSRDERTYVLITGTVGAENSLQKEFRACRVENDRRNRWSGQLLLSARFHYPDLRENGRVIAAKQGISFLRSGAKCTSTRQKLWIELRETGVEETYVPRYDDELWDGVKVIWSRRAYDGGYALLALKTARWSETEKDQVELVRIVKREGKCKRVSLKRWPSNTLTDWCVVADHFVIAKRYSGGTICVYHFDAFCGRVRGVWQCPGIIPPGFNSTVRESHLNRKRGSAARNANPEM